jgi:putative SOS response-associated peptidase YedK
MCGRYVRPDTASIERQWHIGRTNSNPFRGRFNVCPTDTIPILRAKRESGEIELTEARWGFVPHWWKQAKPPSSGFNARSEEAVSKPMWRHAYRNWRCLIPAVGWYEWQAGPLSGNRKAPNLEVLMQFPVRVATKVCEVNG